MILDAGALVTGYPFVARRHGRVPLCDAVAVTACLEKAAELADGVASDEPGAVFFALAAKRRAFPFAWKLMARLAARAQAVANGLTIEARADEFDLLCAEVFCQRATWPDVREWFTSRQRQGPGPTTGRIR